MKITPKFVKKGQKNLTKQVKCGIIIYINQGWQPKNARTNKMRETTLMNGYGNGNGNSGIIGYEFGEGTMTIEYANGGIYTYTRANVGRDNFVNMMTLAMDGEGLNSFINKNVRGRYTKPATVTLTITTTSHEAVKFVEELLKNFDADVKVS